jgi:hypothetical protein
MNPHDLRRGYRSLRLHADESDKEQLLARLRQEAVVVVPRWTRFREWFDGMRRLELAGFATATALAVLMAVGVPMYRNAAGDFGPQVEEMDYDGGSTMVIEDHSAHTTLIWLSEAEDNNSDDDDEDETPPAASPAEKI